MIRIRSVKKGACRLPSYSLYFLEIFFIGSSFPAPLVATLCRSRTTQMHRSAAHAPRKCTAPPLTHHAEAPPRRSRTTQMHRSAALSRRTRTLPADRFRALYFCRALSPPLPERAAAGSAPVFRFSGAQRSPAGSEKSKRTNERPPFPGIPGESLDRPYPRGYTGLFRPPRHSGRTRGKRHIGRPYAVISCETTAAACFMASCSFSVITPVCRMSRAS